MHKIGTCPYILLLLHSPLLLSFRARVLRSELEKQHRAATVMAACVRGLLQRRRFAELKMRHKAATIIQAHARWTIQKSKY